MSLQKQIDKVRAEIKTDSYSMSIGEWVSMYREGEIDIHPEFQRFFRWTDYQKTRFIESILLGIPIPPIFVSQSEGGIWDVVDGLQRLSTIYQFMGLLVDEEDKIMPELILQKTKYLPALEGKIWEDKKKPSRSLDIAQRLFIKRAKLHVNIILRESDEKTKYELFQRLNTGGSPLSDQEVRNCLMVMVDKAFYKNLRDLSLENDFQECIALTDRASSIQYDLELSLRFVLMRNLDASGLKRIGGDVGEFLTDEMMNVMKNGNVDWNNEKKIFKRTFTIINNAIGSNAFRKYDKQFDKFIGGFLLSAFETVALGIGYHKGNVTYDLNELNSRIIKMWSSQVYVKNSGSGVKAESRLPKLIPFGRDHFA